jgi:hypothetical protein
MFQLFIIEAGREPVAATRYYGTEAGKPIVYATGKEAADACAMAARGDLDANGYTCQKLQPRRIADDAWKARELGRFADGTYTALPWADLPALTDHFAHVSTIDGAKIAYTHDAAKGAGDLQTRVKPGRYLAAFYADVYDAPTIARMAAEFDNQFGENLTLSFAVTADDIEDVYVRGPSSCMSNSSDSYQSDEHPVRVYAGFDLQLAYLERDGRVTARALVWPKQKCNSRIYGDETRLRDLLDGAGYSDGDLSGARIARIEHGRGGFVMPYIDGEKACEDMGSHLLIGSGSIGCGNTNGLSGAAFTCCSCGEGVDEDDCRSDGNGNRYCEECYDNDFSNCERYGEECAPDEVREVICNSRYGSRGRMTQFWGQRAQDDHAFECEGNGQLYSDDFLVTLADGTKWSQDYFEDNGTVCEGDSECYASEDCVQLEGGTTWSKDYFADNGVTVDGKLYDKDDAPETDEEEEEGPALVRPDYAYSHRASPTVHSADQLEFPTLARILEVA